MDCDFGSENRERIVAVEKTIESTWHHITEMRDDLRDLKGAVQAGIDLLTAAAAKAAVDAERRITALETRQRTLWGVLGALGAATAAVAVKVVLQ